MKRPRSPHRARLRGAISATEVLVYLFGDVIVDVLHGRGLKPVNQGKGVLARKEGHRSSSVNSHTLQAIPVRDDRGGPSMPQSAPMARAAAGSIMGAVLAGIHQAVQGKGLGNGDESRIEPGFRLITATFRDRSNDHPVARIVIRMRWIDVISVPFMRSPMHGLVKCLLVGHVRVTDLRPRLYRPGHIADVMVHVNENGEHE